MPIYEYECQACGHQFEEWQKISDSPVRKCPTCGQRKVERLVSLSSFHLKGGGWYVTDYGGKKSGSSTPSGDKDSSSAASTSTTPPAKSESKPAATAKSES